MPLRVKPCRKVLPQDLGPGLIAPCGIDCGLCMAYLRSERRCLGCRAGDDGKMKSCLACTIRNCPTIAGGESGFCFDCDVLPCPRLKRLDRRYRTKYGVDLLGNLRDMCEQGVEAFVEAERARWVCPACGGVRCMHTPECIYCGTAPA